MSEADGPDGKGKAAPSLRDGAALKPEMQGKLGEKLKEVYADVLNEHVPDRFLDLLAQLDAKGGASGGGGSPDDDGSSQGGGAA